MKRSFIQAMLLFAALSGNLLIGDTLHAAPLYLPQGLIPEYIPASGKNGIASFIPQYRFRPWEVRRGAPDGRAIMPVRPVPVRSFAHSWPLPASYRHNAPPLAGFTPLAPVIGWRNPYPASARQIPGIPRMAGGSWMPPRGADWPALQPGYPYGRIASMPPYAEMLTPPRSWNRLAGTDRRYRPFSGRMAIHPGAYRFRPLERVAPGPAVLARREGARPWAGGFAQAMGQPPPGGYQHRVQGYRFRPMPNRSYGDPGLVAQRAQMENRYRYRPDPRFTRVSRIHQPGNFPMAWSPGGRVPGLTANADPGDFGETLSWRPVHDELLTDVGSAPQFYSWSSQYPE